MTGSSLAPLIIPIIGTTSLTAWLIMVLSADGHPQRADGNPAHTHRRSGPAKLADRGQLGADPVDATHPAGTSSPHNECAETPAPKTSSPGYGNQPGAG